jgi:hypothetical protein
MLPLLFAMMTPRREPAPAPEGGFESVCGADGNSGQLLELCNTYATRGKGDDTSIAGFVDIEKCRQAVNAWEKRVDK